MPTDEVVIAIKAVDDASAALKNVRDSLAGVDTQAKKTAEGFGKLDAAADKMKGIGQKMTIGVTLPIAGIAIAATKAASDLSETTNKIDTLFGQSSNAIKEWSTTAATALGQSRKQALDAASDFAVFGRSAGLVGDDLVKFSKQNVQLASDMASFFNTSPEEAITAIGAAFRGESEPIRRYGVLINDAALKDEALRLGLIKTTTEALTPQARVLAAQALIMKQTSAAQGDFAKTSDGLANSTRIVNAQLQDTLATLGEKLLPIALKGAVVIKDLLTAFNGLPAPMQDSIIAFAGLAAAAGPVMVIGGKLIDIFGGLKGGAVGLLGGFGDLATRVKDAGEYLKVAGISGSTLKDVFVLLKGSSVVLAGELGLLIVGLIAIAKYIEEVGNASKATTDDLLKMANSGDVFKQAAATTEILAHGQDRLKVALDGTHDKIKEGAANYGDYRSSIEATAKAAGYEIDAQGNLIKVMVGMGGITRQVIQANYALSEAQYSTARSADDVARGADNQAKVYGTLDGAMGKVAGTSKDVVQGAQNQADVYNVLDNAIGNARVNMEKSIETMRAQATMLANSYTLAIQYTESQKKQGEVQAKLDELNQKIASHGPVRTTIIQNEKLSTEELARTQLELAVAQEDLTNVQRKGGETDAEFALRVDKLKESVSNYSEKLQGHTAVVGGATKAELEQKKALEEQLAALQRADEVDRAKGAFEALTKAFRDGLLTQAEYKDRAGALNQVTGLFTQSALDQATAQEVLLSKLADPRAKDWYTSLIENRDALDGVTTAEQQAADKAAVLASSETLDKQTTAAGKFREELGKIPKEIEIKVVMTAPTVKVGQGAGERDKQVEEREKSAAERAAASMSATDKAAEKAISAVGDVASRTTDKVKGVADTTETRLQVMASSISTKFSSVASSVLNAFSDMASKATGDIGDVAEMVNKLPTYKLFTYEIKVIGNIPEGIGGAQSGADFIVPPNPAGRIGDYFPVLAAPGERVIVQTKGQQATAPYGKAGDTINYTYTTNVYNPLAAAMLADKQRRDRVARSNARMGVV